MSHIRRYPRPAHTYYYDATAGNNANTGTAENLPLQTIADLNARALKPGDRVLFKRAETWTGTRLAAAYSGRAGRHILFSAYGAGAAPIIDGGAAAGAFLTNGYNYLTLSNLTMTTGTGATVTIIGHDIALENCTVSGATTNNIEAQGLATLVYRVMIRGCTVEDAVGGSGLYLGRAAGAGGATECVIEDCTFHDNGDTAGTDHGLYLQNADQIIVRRNTCDTNFADGIAVSACTNVLADGNHCVTNGQSGIMFSNMTAAVGVVARNNDISGNTVYGIYLASNSTGISLLHNTTVNNSKDIHLRPGCTGNVVKNNIAVETAGNHAINVGAVADLSNNTINYNCYLRTAGTTKPCQINDTTSYSLAEWQLLAGTPDLNSINVDPEFVTNYTDLHLQATSDCIAAGDPTVGVLADYDSVLRGAAVDIGAYEYV